MKVVDVWQDYDCPHSFDFDLNGSEILAAGDKIGCSGCGQEHKAEEIEPQTHVKFEDGYVEVYPLPADQAQKAAYLAMIGQDVEPREDHHHFDPTTGKITCTYRKDGGPLDGSDRK